MKINDIYRKKGLHVSFEIFPPKGDLSVDSLRNVLDDMKSLRPDFISTTYSAGGTGNSHKTIDLSGVIQNEYGICAMAHLTCINSDEQVIDRAVSALKAQRIENVLALRGDRIEGATSTAFKYAKDLITYLKRDNFCVGAACYPEGHIECNSLDKDIEHLKQKQDAGADFFISQLFFSNDYFYSFLEKTRARAITVPIDAGIMPILSKQQISRMIFMCGASLPAAIIRLLNKYENDPDDLRKAGIEYATKQILDLAANGVDGIHIYTMNQPDIARTQMDELKRAGYERT